MIKQLSDKIWWGDRHAPAEVCQHVGSIINVADNLGEHYWPRLAKVPQLAPYFRLSRQDDNPVDPAYGANLDAVLDLIHRNNWYPLIIHCFAGQHRSTAVAIYAQWRLDGKMGLAEIRQKMRGLHPIVEEDRAFHRSLMAHCETLDRRGPKCPKCESLMYKLTSQGANGIEARGFACYDCEMYDVYFRDGPVVIQSEADFPCDRPLGKPVHAYDVPPPIGGY